MSFSKRTFYAWCTICCVDTGTCIPDYYDFKLKKEVDTTNEDLHLGGGGDNAIRDFFCTWGRGDEGNKILKCYTFDLFTLGINIH